MKKRIIIIIAIIFLFLIGLSVMLYPLISDYVNSKSQSRAVARFNSDIAKLSEENYAAIIEAANAYNKKLLGKADQFRLKKEDYEEYETLFNVNDKGIIGILEIGTIEVKLPIYMGTGEEVLQVGIGHMPGSSLPIGGIGTHSILIGHRGVPSSTLLTNMNQLVIGDMFTLTVLKETLMYEVDHIIIVEPQNFKYLRVDPEKDYCTLITCTPYRVNTHRLLVRGHRVAYDGLTETETKTEIRTITEGASRASAIVACAVAVVPILFVAAIYNLIKMAFRKFRNSK